MNSFSLRLEFYYLYSGKVIVHITVLYILSVDNDHVKNRASKTRRPQLNTIGTKLICYVFSELTEL